MVASFTLLVLELVSVLVHGDLWFVYRKKKHFFEKALFLIPEKQRKTYQAAYRNSLLRNYFCAADKIDVSGTTFTACFTIIYSMLFLMNLLSSELSSFAFWLQALPFFIYFLYIASSYRSTKEFCFYCKFGLIQGAVNFFIGFTIISLNQGVPFGFVIFCSVILACVITVRQALREERQEKRALEKEREEYMKRKI